jgi:predicted amidohydrolase YtcJ
VAHVSGKYGVHVAFGTDAPVEPLNTYLTLYAAVSRQDPKTAIRLGGWLPQEKLSMADAIRNYTHTNRLTRNLRKSEKGTDCRQECSRIWSCIRKIC